MSRVGRFDGRRLRGACRRASEGTRQERPHRLHRQRGHLDVGGGVARRPDPGDGSARQHLDAACDGRRRRRITDLFNDARQPAWSPDGKTIAFFGYRDGGYDLWAIAPDGSNQHKLTWGAFDDREPVYSHDGTRIAFSSDRGDALGSDYNIWILDLRSGALRQMTKDPGNDYMPTWSPDDKEIAFTSTRENSQSIWAVALLDGAERRITDPKIRADAPSWGPLGDLVYYVSGGGQSRLELSGKSLTGNENAFAFRVSWLSPTEFVHVSDGRLRRRSITAPDASPRTIDFTAALQVTHPEYLHRKRDFTSTAPRQVLGIVRPVISPDATKVAFAAIGDIYVMPIGGKPENITKDSYLDTEPAWSPDGTKLVYSSDKGGNLLQLWIRDLKTGEDRQVTRLTTQPMGASWSPDGSRIAFLEVDGMWRRAAVSVVNVATQKVTRIHDSLFGPGMPTWSPDGRRVAVAMVAPVLDALPRGHEPDPHHVGRRRGRSVVRAPAEPLHRLARWLRPRVVPRRHQDGDDLRRGSGRRPGVALGRTVGPAAPHHHRAGARAELGL